MTEGIWIAVIAGAFGLLGTIATGIAMGLVRVVNLLLSRSKETIEQVEKERDYWRGLVKQDRETEVPE